MADGRRLERTSALRHLMERSREEMDHSHAQRTSTTRRRGDRTPTSAGLLFGWLKGTGRMHSTHDLDPFQQFVYDWQQWVRIVELYARRKRARHRLAEADYHRLHSALMKHCENLAHDANEQRREFARRAAMLARPWLTLEALKAEQTCRLLEVLARCADLRRLLLPERGSSPLDKWPASALAFALLVAAAAFLGYWLWGRPAAVDELVRYGQNSLRKFEVAIRWSSFIERFSLIAVILVLVGIRLAYRAQRS